MVALIQPRAGEVVQDPAAGTGGFLVAADRFVNAATNDDFDLPQSAAEFQRKRAFVGKELVQDSRRLGLMNMVLHDIQSPFLLGKTLSAEHEQLGRADASPAPSEESSSPKTAPTNPPPPLLARIKQPPASAVIPKTPKKRRTITAAE